MSAVESLLNMYEEKTQYVAKSNNLNNFPISKFGKEISSPFGTFYMIEKEYPIDYKHGDYFLSSLINNNLDCLCKIIGLDEKLNSIEDILFLDTETTGLSHGVSTYVFLIGLGYFKNKKFVLRQYFMRNFSEELPIFKHFSTFIKSFMFLTTFNGKAFDLNLIKSRATFNRISNINTPKFHIDLLYPSRKIWKNVYENCRLSTLESKVLGVHRNDDIASEIIPYEFFNYINNGETKNIEKIIEHNELDILSMVTLLCTINSYIKNPFNNYVNSKEIFNLGKYYKSTFSYTRALKCFTESLNSGSKDMKYESLKEISLIYKKSLNFEGAASFWHQMIYELKSFSTFPYTELAKYYEHRENNYKKALSLVTEAVKIECSSYLPSNKKIYALNLRRDRLISKSERHICVM